MSNGWGLIKYPKPKSTLDSQKVAKKIAAKNGSLRFFSIRNQEKKDLVTARVTEKVRVTGKEKMLVLCW
jgi:hypothetical protein|tara:strand:+ start:650 stop:856 length:207 start_codon:yes stop_codon:yes gene_type:complete